MKVAHINGVYEIASTGRLIADIVKKSSEEGIESRVFFSEGTSTKEEAIRYISDSERKLHALLSRLTGLQGYWSIKPTKRLLHELEAFQPDIVHLHVLHGNCINLPILFDWLRKCKPAVIITLHDCWWFTGRCSYPMKYGCEKYKTKCDKCPADKDVCPSWFLDNALRMQLDKKRWLEQLENINLVAVSEWGKKIAESTVTENLTITQIYNWVDTLVFCPQQNVYEYEKEQIKSKKIVLGVATIWSSAKGLDDFEWLAEKLPDDYQIVLVGKIPQSYKRIEKVVYIEQTNCREDLAKLYSIAEVFVNPSRQETFGLTTIEAMACGTQAIVYDVTACPELIGEGTGAVISLGNKEVLLDTIVHIKKNASTIEKCRKWVETNFSCDSTVMNYIKLYRKMAK